jgi:hypothetical protein
MNRKPRTDEELRQATDLLYWEIWMFQSLVQGMASGIAGESVINNALLESFGIHVRGLIWFFDADSPRKDDVIAEDFLPLSDTWQVARPKKTAVIEEAKSRADKKIAHLTYARLKVSQEQKPWEFLQIHDDLNKAIERFLRLVADDFLGQRWEEFKQGRSRPTL